MLPEHKHQILAAEVKKRSGLVLGPEKGYLIESRLAPVARAEGMASVEALVDAMRMDQRLAKVVTEALCTHETFFFRDRTPFDMFQNVIIPAMGPARTSNLRIWSAACSSGQEPYSLAILANEMGRVRPDILATDISPNVLEKAKAGLYSQFEVQRGMAIQRLVKHFDQMGDSWKIKPMLRQMVRFEVLNLLDDFRHLGKFDVVFCRNVLIYFDVEDKRRVLERIANQLQPDGFLILGAAETVVGLTNAFRPVPGQRGLYAKPEGLAKIAAA
ncbi:CheR family methyltransferase [Woodsholea maritima]|uniref:CheR family methyltransferase n=1 Tax=Woodsholea maritima TaxID=240237 RepID=UPI00036B0551|nr:protein-glutamate O-methyltransferase CheR [Woodsholea maritima]